MKPRIEFNLIPWKKGQEMDWFTKNQMDQLDGEVNCIVLIEETDFDGKKIKHIDLGWTNGNYIDDFWGTENDWDEGQELHVFAYLPICALIGQNFQTTNL